jgi:predicted amidohydrolase
MFRSTIALLHLAPEPGEIERNLHALDITVRAAARQGAALAVSPELALSGYGFRDRIGTAWIERDQAVLLRRVSGLAREAGIFLAVGLPLAEGGALYNGLIVFAPDGSEIGRHSKINVLRVGCESWSMPGDRPTVLPVEGVGRVGLFICADMYSERLVAETAGLGCDLLLSSAAWAPGEHGPNGEWEWASQATGRPVLVCNRTGCDTLDFTGACSIAAVDGVLANTHASPEAATVLVDWQPATRRLDNWRLAAGRV